MTIYRLQISLQDKSGLPRDQYVSTLHVAPNDGVASVGELESGLNAAAGFWRAIGGRLSPCIPRSIHHARAYLVSVPALDAPPVASLDWELTSAPAGGPLPNEVATCLTFHAARVPNIPPQSTRGRIFIGPLDDTCCQQNPTTGAVTVNPLMPGEFTAAAQAMNTAFDALGLVWVVYSRKYDIGYPVLNVSMDDEFDTMRSRGKRATVNQKVDLTVHGTGPISR